MKHWWTTLEIALLRSDYKIRGAAALARRNVRGLRGGGVRVTFTATPVSRPARVA